MESLTELNLRVKISSVELSDDFPIGITLYSIEVFYLKLRMSGSGT